MEEITEAVRNMRLSQKAYFKNRDTFSLLMSKKREKEVDAMIEDYYNKKNKNSARNVAQQNLFS